MPRASTTVAGTGTRFELTRTVSVVSSPLPSSASDFDAAGAFAGWIVELFEFFGFEPWRGRVLSFALAFAGFCRPDCECELSEAERIKKTATNRTMPPARGKR